MQKLNDMKASLQYSIRIIKYVYDVKYKGETYTAEVYINEEDKSFVEDNIFDEHGHLLNYEGNEGEIREQILNYIAKEFIK